AEIESHFCYPAGSFLLAVPFFAIGVGDFHWVLLFFLLGGLAYALWKIDRTKRFVFLAVIAASIELLGNVAGGDNSVLVFPFLMIGWLLLGKRPIMAACFLGVAVATKQTAWFLVPFALIYIFRCYGWRQVIAGISVVLAVFLAFNTPFLLNNPSQWIDSVLAPLKDAMFPQGVGLVTLVSRGILDIHSSLSFGLMEMLALIGGVVWYFYNARR